MSRSVIDVLRSSASTVPSGPASSDPNGGFPAARAWPARSMAWLRSFRLAAIRAISSGCRYGAISTVVPSLTRLVWPASQASVVNGS